MLEIKSSGMCDTDLQIFLKYIELLILKYISYSVILCFVYMPLNADFCYD